MTTITNLSRRGLLKGAAATSGLVLGFHVGFRKLPFAQAAEGAQFQPNVFLSIDDTGLVTIVASRSEMGTGIKTDLPLVLADELEADWSWVKVVQAQGDPKYGDQNTDGSRSTWQFFEPMRKAGATARQMLETAAAQTWNAPASECRAQNSFGPRPQWAQTTLWPARAARSRFAGSAAGSDTTQGPEGLALYRQTSPDRRPRRHYPGPGHLRHRRGHPGYEICLDRALPGLWRQGEVL
jgi:CO/xanthine dehydrogenase Mo-binding subunit